MQSRGIFESSRTPRQRGLYQRFLYRHGLRTSASPLPPNGKNRRPQDGGVEILIFTEYHGTSHVEATAKRRGLKTVLAARRVANKQRQLTQSATRSSAIFCIFFCRPLLRRSRCTGCGYFGIQCAPPPSPFRETFRRVQARGTPEFARFFFSFIASSLR